MSLKGGALLTLPAAEILSLRELYFEYSPPLEKIPFNHSIRLIQDSYDDFVWGDSTRWGAKWIINFIDGPIVVKAGPGVSLTSTYSLKNQTSFDLYLELKHSIFMVEIDNLFFKDGFFNKNSIGVEFDLNPGKQNLKMFFGLGGYLNSDYKKFSYYPTLLGGLSYEF
ncbi:MAG: hypothetical protein V3V48_08260 [Candidatus Aminicenantaceae bacterium]